MSRAEHLQMHAQNGNRRVLIVVKGGVADYVADEGVEVEIFDWDDYKDAPDLTVLPSNKFADLAMSCNIPLVANSEKA
jgi:hypothetical protein